MLKLNNIFTGDMKRDTGHLIPLYSPDKRNGLFGFHSFYGGVWLISVGDDGDDRYNDTDYNVTNTRRLCPVFVAAATSRTVSAERSVH